MKGLDLRGFKKHSEDEKFVKLLHAKGHQIHVAKFALDEKTRRGLKALPMASKEEIQAYVDGGLVGEDKPFSHDPSLETSTPDVEYRNGVPQVKGKGNLVNGSANSYGQSKREAASHPPVKMFDGGKVSPDDSLPTLDNEMSKMGMPGMDTQEALGQPSMTGIPTPPQPTEAPEAPQDVPDEGPATLPQPQASTAPIGQPSASAGMPGIGMVQQGLRQEAKAQGDLGQAQADVYQGLQDNLGALDKSFAARDAELHQEYQNLHKDFMDGHIDPNRLWASKSTGAKIGAALGIILSGLGSGMAHQENSALKVIDSAIERDIDAQRADLGKKHSLLQDNLQRTNDARSAYALTKAQLLTVAEAQLKKAAAQAATPIAQAQYLQKAGALQMQIGQLGQQVAQRTALADAMAHGGANNPQIMGMAIQTFVPKERQGEAFKQLEMAQNARQSESAIMDAFDRAAAENSMLGRASRLGMETPAMKEFDLLGQPLIKDKDGRVNELELHSWQKMKAGLLSRNSDVKRLREGVLSFIRSKQSTPLLDMVPGYSQSAGASSASRAPQINFTPAKR